MILRIVPPTLLEKLSRTNNAGVFLLLCFSLLVGLLTAAPQFLIRRAILQSGGTHLWIQVPYYSDETEFYLPRAREVADGHFLPSDLHVVPNKSLAMVLPPLPPLIFGSLLSLAPDVNQAYFFLHIISPAIIFILLYYIGYALTGERIWSFFLGFMGTLTPAFAFTRDFSSVERFTNLVIKNFIPVVQTFLDRPFLSRIDNPLLTLPFYLATILSLYLLWSKPSMRRAVIASFALGLLFYTYFFYWVFIVVFSSLLFLHDFFYVKQNIKTFFVFVALSVILFIPYAINYLSFSDAPYSGEYLQRLSFERGRMFRVSYWRDYLIYGLLGLAAYFLLKKNDRRKLIFFLAAIATMFIVTDVIQYENISSDNFR